MQQISNQLSDMLKQDLLSGPTDPQKIKQEKTLLATDGRL